MKRARDAARPGGEWIGAGGLHVLGAVAILGLASVLTFRAWRGDRVPAPAEAAAAAEAADPVTTRPGSPG